MRPSIARALTVILASGALWGAQARADTCEGQTPCCDTSADPGNGTLGMSEQTCLSSLTQLFGATRVVNDIFHTSNTPPLKARDLDDAGLLAHVMNPQLASSCICSTTADGNTVADVGYSCLGSVAYQCGTPAAMPGLCYPDGGTVDLVTMATYAGDHVDHISIQNFRLTDAGADVNNGDPGAWVPSRGFIYDLGNESNKVAVFALMDHGPFPCESFEYEVFVTDDLNASEITDPAQNCVGINLPGGGASPGSSPCIPGVVNAHQWNRAVLYKAFLGGWDDQPLPDGGPRWDPDAGINYLADGYGMVFTLPCGISFRYASLVPGNAGNPSPYCTFYSNEYELDAVAGLNSDESAVCPDADHDGYPACSCSPPGVVCDCNDNDPTVHPGAPEDCGSTKDYACLGHLPTCPAGYDCVTQVDGGFVVDAGPQSDGGVHECLARCTGGELSCPGGGVCSGGHCITGSCAGVVCGVNEVCMDGACLDPCAGAVCPPGLDCKSGQCIDLCRTVACPQGQLCSHGLCFPGCGCDPEVCDGGQICSDDGGFCVEADCAQVDCDSTQECVEGTCVDICSVTTCPLQTMCSAGVCVPDPCATVACDGGMCLSGMCVDDCTAAGNPCGANQTCVNGACEGAIGGSSGTGTTGNRGTTTGGALGGTTGLSGASAGSGGGKPDAGNRSQSVTSKGCGCGQSSDFEAWWALIAPLGLAGRRTRARRLGRSRRRTG